MTIFIIIINLVSVKRGVIYLLADVKRTKKSEDGCVFLLAFAESSPIWVEWSVIHWRWYCRNMNISIFAY